MRCDAAATLVATCCIFDVTSVFLATAAARRPPQSGPDAGAGLGSDYIWNKGNKLFVSEPKPHGGTTEVTAVVGHALLDAYELIVSGTLHCLPSRG